MIRYVVFNEHSSYNFLLRKPSLNKLRFVVSNIHLKVKYPINRKFGWCYKGRLRCDTTLLNGKLKNKRSNFVLQNKRIIIILDLDPRVSFKEICFQLVKSLKEVFLEKKRKKKVNIGFQFEEDLEKWLITILRENIRAFFPSWQKICHL